MFLHVLFENRIGDAVQMSGNVQKCPVWPIAFPANQRFRSMFSQNRPPREKCPGHPPKQGEPARPRAVPNRWGKKRPVSPATFHFHSAKSQISRANGG